jgi:cytochrome c peroxidase
MLASMARTRHARPTGHSAQLRCVALWRHAPYFHDGSAATLADVVAHYNRVRSLGLTIEQQRDLVEYLKSL